MSALSSTQSIAPPSRRPRWLKRFLAATVAALVAGGGIFAVTETAAAATVDPTAWYVLLNRNSGKALDVSGVSTAISLTSAIMAGRGWDGPPAVGAHPAGSRQKRKA